MHAPSLPTPLLHYLKAGQFSKLIVSVPFLDVHLMPVRFVWLLTIRLPSSENIVLPTVCETLVEKRRKPATAQNSGQVVPDLGR